MLIKIIFEEEKGTAFKLLTEREEKNTILSRLAVGLQHYPLIIIEWHCHRLSRGKPLPSLLKFPTHCLDLKFYRVWALNLSPIPNVITGCT